MKNCKCLASAQLVKLKLIDFFEINMVHDHDMTIWPGVMAPDRRDWISLKSVWHMTSNITQVELKKRRSHANSDRSILV